MIKVACACIGKYSTDSDVDDILVESRVFGDEVVNKSLSGSHYARSIKGYFLLAEALERLQFLAFCSEASN